MKHLNHPVTAALVLVGVAFAVRTLSLTQQSLWLDEVYSIWFVNRPFDEAWRVGIFPDQNPHAPLYYLVLWSWLQGAGASDFAVRYLSVLFGVASVAVVWRAAREWLGVRAGLIAALLIVCSPFAIYFAQEARMYALYLLLAALSFLCMIRALKPDRNPFRYWLGMAAASVALAYSHFFGVFWIAALYALALVVAWPAAVGASVTQRRRHPLLQRYALILATGALAALACLPIPISLMGSGRTYSLRDVTSPVIPLGAMLRDLVAEFATRTRWADLPENWVLALTIPLVGLL
ncbi:MAG: glycosyltransferase family 39 protein [Anaerolineae bacterium]